MSWAPQGNSSLAIQKGEKQDLLLFVIWIPSVLCESCRVTDVLIPLNSALFPWECWKKYESNWCSKDVFSDIDFFLLPISGYICHGGWKEEPLSSQNTFSKVLKKAEEGEKESSEQYWVISSAASPQQRICVHVMMDHDNSNVSFLANNRHCPKLTVGEEQSNGQLWSFNLTRTSKNCFFAELTWNCYQRDVTIFRWMCTSSGNCQCCHKVGNDQIGPSIPTADTAFHIIAYFTGATAANKL